jgi:sulfate transport system ATP-binding protein
VRKELRRWLRRLHDDMHVTSVFVTHDQEEAMEVADRVVVMNHGRIEQDGPPDQVYDHPASPFVLQFLGDVNRFGAVDSPDSYFVRPHDFEVLGAASADSHAVTLAQALTVGPNTRLEFKRADDGSFLEVEMPRADYAQLRQTIGLAPGSLAHLKPRRITRFAQTG